MKKEKRERNIQRPIRVGAVEIARTGAVGIAETSVEGMAETGATGAAGEVAVGISVSAVTPGSSKISTIRGMDMQNKGRPQQRGDTETYV